MLKQQLLHPLSELRVFPHEFGFHPRVDPHARYLAALKHSLTQRNELLRVFLSHLVHRKPRQSEPARRIGLLTEAGGNV